MSAYEVETLLGAGLIAAGALMSLYALPTWIVRRCER